MATVTGFKVLLFAVSLSIINIGGVVGVLLSFIGVLAGTSLIFAGVVRMMADGPATAPVGRPAVFGGARALTAFMLRNLAVVGLLMASSAATAVASGEPGLQIICFGMLLLGVSLVHVGVLGE